MPYEHAGLFRRSPSGRQSGRNPNPTCPNVVSGHFSGLPDACQFRMTVIAASSYPAASSYHKIYSICGLNLGRLTCCLSLTPRCGWQA